MRQLPEKLLVLQFKYLVDAVFLTPALRALKAHQPAAELHVLVAAEIAPIFAHLPWITKVWGLPRTRGKARLRDSWPVIRALRREAFDRSVDFGGNDRGAILSFLSGARQRLGAADKNSFLQKACYTTVVSKETLPPPYVQNHLKLLAAWQIPPPQSLSLELAADAALAGAAEALLPPGCVVCHLGTSEARKEWPLIRWQEFYRLAHAAGFSLAFSSGPGEREQALVAGLKKLQPDIFALPPLPSLPTFLAVLQRARAMVSGDTAPLHMAAGLGVPVIGLFGASDSLWRAAPNYPEQQVVKNTETTPASGSESCLAGIPAARVLAALTALITPQP